MPKNEGSSNYTGETGNPLVQRQRRTTTGWQTDAQAAQGDGQFQMDGARRGSQGGMGKPGMGYAARRKRGMR